eukprot:39094_1
MMDEDAFLRQFPKLSLPLQVAAVNQPPLGVRLGSLFKTICSLTPLRRSQIVPHINKHVLKRMMTELTPEELKFFLNAIQSGKSIQNSIVEPKPEIVPSNVSNDKLIAEPLLQSFTDIMLCFGGKRTVTAHASYFAAQHTRKWIKRALASAFKQKYSMKELLKMFPIQYMLFRRWSTSFSKSQRDVEKESSYGDPESDSSSESGSDSSDEEVSESENSESRSSISELDVFVEELRTKIGPGERLKYFENQSKELDVDRYAEFVKLRSTSFIKDGKKFRVWCDFSRKNHRLLRFVAFLVFDRIGQIIEVSSAMRDRDFPGSKAAFNVQEIEKSCEFIQKKLPSLVESQFSVELTHHNTRAKIKRISSCSRSSSECRKKRRKIK